MTDTLHARITAALIQASRHALPYSLDRVDAGELAEGVREELVKWFGENVEAARGEIELSEMFSGQNALIRLVQRMANQLAAKEK